MKKSMIFLAFICVTLVFSACSAPVSNAAAVEAAEQSTAPAPEQMVDSGLTLGDIKKAAQDAGCAVEDVQDFQMIDEPKPVGGFNLIYKDEYNESHIPVLEFKNADEAVAYAQQVNAAGYNISIVNGKYMTITGAQYGITTNDKETALLEKIMNSKVMKYVEAAPVRLEPAKDFAGAYLQVDAISKAMDKLINRSILLHDKTVPEAERISTTFFTSFPVSSMDLAFLSALKEDQTYLDAVIKAWEMFGCTDVKLSHDAPHNYTLTGKRAGVDTAFEIKCSFDPGTGSLRLIDTDGGEVAEFYEFVPLGSDRYAFQMLYARAIVEYKDGKINSFVYTLNKADKSLAYNSGADGIYGKSGAADEAWAVKAGEDSYEQYMSYNGTKLKIATDTFMGERLKAEIDAQ